MIKYSVIVPFHSNINLLTICIAALCKTLDFSESEIILVDNNADGSQIPPDWELRKQCRIISKHDNLMYPSAINLGVESARGIYLIFCDADTYVIKNFQRTLTDALEDDGIGYAAAKLLNMCTGHLLEFGITASRYNFPHPFTGRQRDFELIKNSHTPLAACAACSAIKRELFTNIGGFDTKLVHSYSDIDLCLRLRERQYRTICVADATAYHRGASTTGSGMGAGLKEDTKGAFMAKHPQIPIQIAEYVNAACAYFLQHNRLRVKDYFTFDGSTIADPEMYINTVIDAMNLRETNRYRHPYSLRDAGTIDFLNVIPYQIRNYRIPILYFVDNFLTFRGNLLWKLCREDFVDIVVDRHANIELLRNI